MFGDGSALLPEYEPYLIATIEQEGEGGGGSDDGFSISESENNQMYQPLGYYTFEDLTNGDPDADEDIANNWDVIEAGGKLYRLTYTSTDLMGSISFLLNGEYANIIASSTGNWLDTESYDNEINVTMDASGNTNSDNYRQTAKQGPVEWGGAPVFKNYN